MKNDFLIMFLYYTRNTLKSWFQYKIDAILRSFAVFLREATGIIIIYFTLAKFNDINGWNINEMFFLYSFLFATYGILIIFFTGLRDFGRIVQDGRLDRLMLRPRGVLFQIIAINSDWFAAIGHGFLGITLFVISASKVGIVWSFVKIIYVIMTIIGGVLVQGALFLFFASFNFYLIKTDNFKDIFYWNMRKFAGYPISIFHKYIQWLLIYIIPFAFVNYFPAQFLLRKNDISGYPAAFMYISPFVGVILYLLAYLFWLHSIKYYKSTGN